MSHSIRILIADNDECFANNLRNFLDQQGGLKVFQVVRDGSGAVSTCEDALPDLVLMDLHLPVLDSINAIQAILAQNERIKILGLSSSSPDPYAVEAVKAGASGCISKNGQDSFESIVKAIRLVINGEVLLDPMLASSILQEFHRLSE